MSLLTELGRSGQLESSLHHARLWMQSYYKAQEPYLRSFPGPHHFTAIDWPDTEAAWDASLPWREVYGLWNNTIVAFADHICRLPADALVIGGSSARALLLNNQKVTDALQEVDMPVSWLQSDDAAMVYNNAILHQGEIDMTRRIQAIQIAAQRDISSIPEHVLVVDDIVRSAAKISEITEVCIAAGIGVSTAVAVGPFTSPLIQFTGSTDSNLYAYIVNLAASMHFLGDYVWQKRVAEQSGGYREIQRLSQLVDQTVITLNSVND